MEEHFLRVSRTARYHSIGEAATATGLWVVLHGYGQLARFFLRPFVGLEKGALIVAPEALSRFYTDEAHSRVGATWMTREDREHEMGDQVEYLDLLVSRLRIHNGTPLFVNVLGFSQGVATACRWAVRGKTRFSTMVLWSGTMPPEIGPMALQAAFKDTRIVLVHGETDTITPENVLLRNEATIRESGLPQQTMRFNGGHQLDRLVLDRILGGR